MHRPASHPAPRRRLAVIGCFPISRKLNPYLSCSECDRPNIRVPASRLGSTKDAQMPSIKQIEASRTNATLFKRPSHARGNKPFPSNSVRLFLGLPPAKCLSTQRSLTPTSAQRSACSHISATVSRRMGCAGYWRATIPKNRHTARPQEEIEKKEPKISKSCRCASNSTHSRAHST